MAGGFHIINPFAKARLFDNVYVCKKCKRKFRWRKKKGLPQCPYCGSKAIRQKKLPLVKK